MASEAAAKKCADWQRPHHPGEARPLAPARSPGVCPGCSAFSARPACGVPGKPAGAIRPRLLIAVLMASRMRDVAHTPERKGRRKDVESRKRTEFGSRAPAPRRARRGACQGPNQQCHAPIRRRVLNENGLWRTHRFFAKARRLPHECCSGCGRVSQVLNRCSVSVCGDGVLVSCRTGGASAEVQGPLTVAADSRTQPSVRSARRGGPPVRWRA